MQTTSRIFVAGHRGMVGGAICRRLHALGFKSVITRTHAELDLTHAPSVANFFAEARPEYVFLAAAKVGGIMANYTQPADFITDNLAIQQNVITACHIYGARRLLFLGSSCIYPKNAPQPLREEYLLSDYLEPTNSAYAIAKIAGVESCRAYNTQYGTQYVAVMPTNLYGIGDNYHPENSHVLPALIRRLHEAKKSGSKEVVIWGDGTPLREFLFSEDLAQACVFLMQLNEEKYQQILTQNYYPLLNIGSGEELSIAELAERVAQCVGYTGAFVYDKTKPNGTMRKVLDCTRIHDLGWRAQVALAEGLRYSYEDFCIQYP